MSHQHSMLAVNGNLLEESAHTVATMTHQHSMPTVNVSIVLGNVLEESIVLWECLGMFGNVLEESIVLWECLGMFWRNLLFFGNIYCLKPEAPVTST